MVRTVIYRGPDETGVFTDGPIGLAHNRLSIVDIAGGRQPMECDSGAVRIIFNGEIFNFIELRKELIQKGHRFATRSDTEVILRLYQQYGDACVERMNGQWAFALWDAKRRRLFLSRDRVGVIPLFYTTVGSSFLFGSEVKTLLAFPGVAREIDLQALRQIFTYWYPLPPKTFFKNILELPPGHSMVVETGRSEVRRYWQIDFESANSTVIDAGCEKRYADQLCELLYDSTCLRLRADVPVASYLSGGLDSSIVSALAQKAVGSSLQTFSIGFDDPAFDESDFQLEVARQLGTVHRSFACSGSDVCAVFPEVIRHAERPLLRTAPAPLFLLSKMVRESGLKVVLTGEGSDEFFGGYDIFKETKIRAFWASRLDSKLRPRLLKRLYPYLSDLQKQPLSYLQAFFHVGKDGAADPFFSHMPRWALTARTQAIFSANVRSGFRTADIHEDFNKLLPADFQRWTPFARAQYLESAFLLPNYLLSSQGDRVSMANSVEARYPFLDHRVIEYATKIPAHLKMKVLNEKYLLKRAFGDLIPASVAARPKQPYRAPDAASFFNCSTAKPRQEYVEHLLGPERIRETGLFDERTVEKLVEKAKTGKISGFLENAAFVGLLSTQITIDEFIFKKETLTDGATDGMCLAAY